VPVTPPPAGNPGELPATAIKGESGEVPLWTAERWWPRCAGIVRRAFARFASAGWALADQSIVSAANFLTIYLFARYLTTSDFGAFMLAYTGLMLMTSMQTAIVIQPHNVLAAGLPRKEYREFTGALLVMQMTFCAAICAVLGAIGWVLAQSRSYAAGSVLIALAVAAVPWMGQEFVRRVLYTRSESRAAALNDSATYGLQLLGALVLMSFWADRASPEAALAVLGTSSLAGVLMGARQLRSHVRLRRVTPGAIKRTWAEVWKFGKWLTGQNALVWLGTHGHSWIVGLLLGAEQVGFYRAATHIANLMNPLRQAAYSYLPSRGSLAYQTGAAGGLSRWVRTTALTLLLALVPFYVLLVGFPGSVLAFAYGDRYAGADLALILALSTIAQCITFSKFPLDIGLLALRATKSIFYVHLIPVVLLFTSGVGLVYYLGIVGVPLSSILINSALLLATWMVYTNNLKRTSTHAE
jgi:O-antigen/teichoic acid export membrane protein